MLIAWKRTTDSDHYTVWQNYNNTGTIVLPPLRIIYMGQRYRLTVNGQFSTLITDTLADCIRQTIAAFTQIA